MLTGIVIAAYRPTDIAVVTIVAMARIAYLVAIVMVTHKRMDIRVIMTHEHRRGVAVVRREVPPVPRGMPGNVIVPADMSEDMRPCNENGADNIIRTINEWITYDFDVIVCVRRYFCNNGGDILIDIGSDDCLNHEYVIVTLHCRHHPEVIDVTVPVQVEVAKHIG